MHSDTTTPAAAVRAQADALAAQVAVLRALADAMEAGLAHEASPPAVEVRLCDKREVARTLDVSIAKIDRLDREGQPFVRVGDAKRYDVTAVLAWHRERSAQATEPPTVPPSSVPAAPSGVRCLSRSRTAKGAR
jgi:hypothetical protein